MRYLVLALVLVILSILYLLQPAMTFKKSYELKLANEKCQMLVKHTTHIKKAGFSRIVGKPYSIMNLTEGAGVGDLENKMIIIRMDDELDISVTPRSQNSDSVTFIVDGLPSNDISIEYLESGESKYICKFKYIEKKFFSFRRLES